MRIPLFVALFTLAACGAQPTMETAASELGTQAMALQTEFDAHASKAAAAADVSALATLDGAHRTAALADLTAADGSVTHMGTCTNTAKASPDMMMCKDALAAMRTAAEKHASTMSAITVLADAKAEEDRYHKAMAAQVTTLMGQSDTLKTGAAKYMCNGANMSSM